MNGRSAVRLERLREAIRRNGTLPLAEAAALCAEAGLNFVPFIVEAEGGFGKDARIVLAALADASANLTGEARSVRAEMAKQCLSVSLQRSNALAIARRAPGGGRVPDGA